MNSSRNDIIIVGGGPAGITTALALGKLSPSLASRVVVLEAEAYPREKPCAGALGGRGDQILGELDARVEVPSAPIDGMSFRAEGGEMVARVGRIGRVVRRIEFDHALARVALQRGVKIMEQTRVLAVRAAKDGAVVETNQGELTARLVVGADGVGSVVRKAMDLGRGALRAQVLELDTEPVTGDRARNILHFDASDRRFSGYTWDFPTVVDGEPLVCRGIYHLKREGEDVDIRALLSERLAGMGLELSRYKNKRFAERGFEPALRLDKGPMMLVGEAAGIDPITGEGIAQAIEHGAMAGRFLVTAYEQKSAAGWSNAVRRSRLYRDLSLRTRALTMFYGATRPRMERFLTSRPEALHVGCQYFGAKAIDKSKLLRLALSGGAAALAAVVRGGGGEAHA